MDHNNFHTIMLCIFAITIYGTYIKLYAGEKSPSNKIIFYLFWAGYVFGYSYLTFLNRKAGSHNFIFNPLKPITDDLKNGKFPYEPVLNLLLVVPFGMTLPIIKEDACTYKKAAAIGGAISLITEIMQIISGLGEFEASDIVSNTLGTVAGLALYFHFLSRK